MTARVPPPAGVPVILPNGLRATPGPCSDDGHRRHVALRPITGRDEEALLRLAGEPPATLVSALLGRCLVEVGGEPVTDGIGTARRLTVGDREALLLHLRRLTFGDAVEAVLDCPRDECGAKMDVALSIGDLLIPPPPEPRTTFEAGIEADGGPFTAHFRLPTGADQEDAATRLRTHGGGAAVALLAARCLCALTRADGTAVDLGSGVEELPPAVLGGLSAAIADADPQAELLLRLACPECGHGFSSRFDAGAYLLAELAGAAGRADALYRQVHGLALHYHWSETEILGLTPGKRRLYLDLVADALAAPRSGSGRTGAVA